MPIKTNACRDMTVAYYRKQIQGRLLQRARLGGAPSFKLSTYGQGTVDGESSWVGSRDQPNERRYPSYLRYPRFRSHPVGQARKYQASYKKNPVCGSDLLVARESAWTGWAVGGLIFVPLASSRSRHRECIKLGSRPKCKSLLASCSCLAVELPLGVSDEILFC